MRFSPIFRSCLSLSAAALLCECAGSSSDGTKPEMPRKETVQARVVDAGALARITNDSTVTKDNLRFAALGKVHDKDSAAPLKGTDFTMCTLADTGDRFKNGDVVTLDAPHAQIDATSGAHEVLLSGKADDGRRMALICARKTSDVTGDGVREALSGILEIVRK